MDVRLASATDGAGQLHRLLTSNFLHCGLLHLIFNLGYLYILAPIEVQEPGLYLVIFLLSGIGGNMAFSSWGSGQRVLGASAGICGLIAYELIGYARERRDKEFSDLLKQMFGTMVLGAFLPGVSNWSHLGGLLTGFAITLLCGRRSGYRRALVPWPILLALSLLWSPARMFLLALFKALALGISQPGALAQGIRF
eukprot:TRINITY_DN70544_c0_g1_i2.p1 TRINITY_DN70544_c0_g1~~TRINITY_DN70544_c0_g1_i2.p1  ORF type:complete len:196 (-),score=27.93 TRINITY_DN70544_c0_g1_i2:2-589(-)